MAKQCKYPKLDGKITEIFGTRRKFAKALGISENSVSAKMSGTSPWKLSEVERARGLLNISECETHNYFLL